jgi:tRNA G10  N-methylase Trm11
MSYAIARQENRNHDANRLQANDQAVHSWYRFVLSFPPHLVRDTIAKFRLEPGAQVLDPFCGTGTTLAECKKNGIASIGIEANIMAEFASSVKTNWQPDPDGLRQHARQVAEHARTEQPRFEGLPGNCGVH